MAILWHSTTEYKHTQVFLNLIISLNYLRNNRIQYIMLSLFKTNYNT